jgi:hypothetical protein
MGLMVTSVGQNRPVQLCVEFLSNLLVHNPRRDFQIRIWDGSRWGEKQLPCGKVTSELEKAA